MKYFKLFFALFFLLVLFVFLSAYSYVSAISNNLYNSVFRLHVIANSDSVDDQNLKYMVRDNIINYINQSSSEFSSKDDVIEFSKNHIEKLQKIAEDTIKTNGYNYPVTIEIGNFEFPTKKYGDISFPAGFYDGLKVNIGSANGQNWWCVMFPPLCFVDVSTGIVPDSSKKELQDNLSKENFKIISESDNSDVLLKFKIIEFFEKSGLITARK